MRLSAVLSVVFVLMAVTQAATLSKHGGEAHHASSKHAAKKSKSKKAVSQKAPSAAKKSHKDAPGAAKKGHKKNRHTTTLVQAKQHEEDFGTTGGGGEEPQQAGPAPAAPPAARPASGGGAAATVWSGEINRYGPCLRDFASLVSNNECAQEKLGDVEYFLETVNQEEHTLSAGYKTGMARKGMVIEGIGMNASSSEATPLTRHAFQRSRVELAYACAPAGSECKSHMTPVNEIDSSIGKDKECPAKLMQGGTHPAMRGRFVQIVHAYSTNSDAYFWGNSRQYAAAVAVCFYIRTYGKGGSQTAPPGMLLKENIYDPAPAGVVVDLEEGGDGGDVVHAPSNGQDVDGPSLYVGDLPPGRLANSMMMLASLVYKAPGSDERRGGGEIEFSGIASSWELEEPVKFSSPALEDELEALCTNPRFTLPACPPVGSKDFGTKAVLGAEFVRYIVTLNDGPQYVYIGIRGSSTKEDWCLADNEIRLGRDVFQAGTRFRRTYAMVKDTLALYPGHKIVITGHSLAGRLVIEIMQKAEVEAGELWDALEVGYALNPGSWDIKKYSQNLPPKVEVFQVARDAISIYVEGQDSPQFHKMEPGDSIWRKYFVAQGLDHKIDNFEHTAASTKAAGGLQKHGQVAFSAEDGVKKNGEDVIK